MDTAVEVAAVLMFTALKNHDKVGMALFADDVIRYIPPHKGRSNVLRLIRDLLAVEPVKATTDIAKALEFVGRVQRRKCVCFLMSDFIGPDCSHALAVANKRHDVVAITLSDPRELEMPDVVSCCCRTRNRVRLWRLIRIIRACARCLRKMRWRAATNW